MREPNKDMTDSEIPPRLPVELIDALGEYYDLCLTLGIGHPSTQSFKQKFIRDSTHKASFSLGAEAMENLVREIHPDGLGR